MKHIIYTQPNCFYCDVMKGKFDVWQVDYEIIDISKNREAKQFLKDNGYKTVPQVFYNGVNLNNGIQTVDFSRNHLMVDFK